MSFALWLTLHIVIGVPLAIIVGNFGEWAIHKYLLHGRGKQKGHFFNFHYYDHHAESRKNGMVDPAYLTRWLGGGWNPRTKEATSLIVGAIPWLFLLPYAPGFAIGSLYTSWNYYWVHKKAHLDPEWARENVPWHYDHHMGPDQEANWGVTRPWFDDLLGTRKRFVGTEQEVASRGRAKRPRGAHARQADTTAPVEA